MVYKLAPIPTQYSADPFIYRKDDDYALLSAWERIHGTVSESEPHRSFAPSTSTKRAENRMDKMLWSIEILSG
jgi:hypothetical protein